MSARKTTPNWAQNIKQEQEEEAKLATLDQGSPPAELPSRMPPIDLWTSADGSTQVNPLERRQTTPLLLPQSLAPPEFGSAPRQREAQAKDLEDPLPRRPQLNSLCLPLPQTGHSLSPILQIKNLISPQLQARQDPALDWQPKHLVMSTLQHFFESGSKSCLSAGRPLKNRLQAGNQTDTPFDDLLSWQADEGNEEEECIGREGEDRLEREPTNKSYAQLSALDFEDQSPFTVGDHSDTSSVFA